MQRKKKLTHFIFTVLLLGLCSMLVMGSFAQEKNAEKEKALKFSIDWNRFRYSDSLTFLEYSISLYRDLLKFVPFENEYRAEFQVTATLMQGDSIVTSKQWKNMSSVDSLAAITGTQRLFSVNNFVVPAGKYQMDLKIVDTNSGKEKSYRFPLVVKNFPAGELLVSDMQLSTKIQRDTTKNMLVKNGYRIYPNPTRLYGIGLPILYCYSEIYNLAPATSDSGAYYKVNYKILNADGQVVKTFPARKHKKPGDSAVEVNGVNVVTLVSGAYSVLMEVKDFETGKTTQDQQKFFVYRQGDYAEGGAAFKKKDEIKGTGSPGVDAARYDVMPEKELDQEFNYCRYISTKNEKKTYKKLTLDGKRKYIKEFWAKRDPHPNTPTNDYKRKYLGLVQYANQAFRGNFRKGWRTDRGRVILIYGRPDEVERFPFSNEHKAYEIWHYFSVQGGVDFIFVDRRDMGEYELVHSTARGELYDTDWQRWIDPNR